MSASKRYRVLSGICTVAIVLASAVFVPVRAEADQRTFVVEMRDFQFFPNLVQADPGDNITIRVFNNDSTGHTFDLTEFNVHIGTRASPLLAGRNATATFIPDRNGTFWFFCDIPGHASQAGSGYTGMAGRLIVGPVPAPQDLTIPIVAAGIATGAILVGVALWFRRRSGRA